MNILFSAAYTRAIFTRGPLAVHDFFLVPCLKLIPNLSEDSANLIAGLKNNDKKKKKTLYFSFYLNDKNLINYNTGGILPRVVDFCFSKS